MLKIAWSIMNFMSPVHWICCIVVTKMFKSISCFLLDNALSHHSVMVDSYWLIIDYNQLHLISHLPPYSPFLNSVVHAFKWSDFTCLSVSTYCKSVLAKIGEKGLSVITEDFARNWNWRGLNFMTRCFNEEELLMY